MHQPTLFFHELPFDQLNKLIDSKYNLEIDPRTTSHSLLSVNKQLVEFKRLLECFYFSPYKFEVSPFFRLDPLMIFNFLKFSHQYYLDKKIPEIEQYIQLVRAADDTPEVRVLSILFNDYKNHLVQHISFEEENVFPLIHQIIESRSDDTLLCHSVQVKTQLASFYLEHSDTEKDLNAIQLLVGQLSQGETGVASILSNQLAVFDVDLKLHHLLEEEILIPSVLDILY